MKIEDMENINEKFHLLVDGLNALWSQFILAWREALDPDLEYNTRVEEEIIPTLPEKTEAETKGGLDTSPPTEEEKSKSWIHEGKRYKNCKYHCGNLVSWNTHTNNYDHYTKGYKFISVKCPLYMEGK